MSVPPDSPPPSAPPSPSRPRPRPGAGVAGVGLAALGLTGLLWLGGLFWFAGTIPREIEDEGGRTDAIVVLTGGSERLEAGFALLAAGRAETLFISGVYHTVDVRALLRLSQTAPAALECCVVLGYTADDTVGNAQETARWVRAQGYHSLRLVTANYHMPRSLVEFHHALPDVLILPYPVQPPLVRLDRWWRWRGTASLIISEYDKFLAAIVRQTLADMIPRG